ncbi:toll/interleukin-1 receptor domain-containing protein [Kitasatospora sp. SUK 42]|uniref:toll/interleukin-1 receptor domain-containing protein n=1 Tax=Kitasatospora sp. SUK 42 TaxID=1588882 RepID=UPI0018CA2893|nr:toll/interleukin-1 receptor domain-containing protein [Kitasatospora sp. SUK 42]MBV2153000.1 toll/interleukin-1 receptor domain-containing protein [Kitasatospora sp. SUK 42]
MPEIFVNYRTKDEDSTATLIERELSQRFGTEQVFRASKSIGIGGRYPQDLLTAVRRCSVLIAVIGEDWADARTADGLRALDDPEDWTRREIAEAFRAGALVVPVLVGRTTRLDRHKLPPEIAELADCQYRRFDNRDAESGLRRLGDDLAEALPQLAEAEGRSAEEGGGSEVHNEVGWVDGTVVQARDYRHEQSGGIGSVGRDVGTFINNASGQVNTGSGPQNITVRHGGVEFHGDGSNYVEHGTVNNDFGGRRDREERQR